jgi:Fungal chitosanase of glycosyl hydrolase group 75
MNSLSLPQLLVLDIFDTILASTNNLNNYLNRIYPKLYGIMTAAMRLFLVLPFFTIIPFSCNKNVVTDACDNPEFTSIENFSVFRLIDGTLTYRAKFAIDADGSPRAYGPNNTGLDLTEHAINGTTWVGVVTDDAGLPIVQKAGNPYPGLYVSQTSLFDTSYVKTDPRRYVDAEKIPYIVLPETLMIVSDIKIGDMAYAYNPKTGKGAYAVLADVGPEGLLGEGSIRLAKDLGIPNISPRDGGLEGAAIQYVVFPNTSLGNGKPPTYEQINNIGRKQMQKLGGESTVLKCF